MSSSTCKMAITGDTGSGKTRSGINQLLFQVFQNDPNWGELCIDDKGVYWETLVEMAVKFNRQSDLILLQVRPDNPPDKWKPAHTFILLSDPTIPPFIQCITGLSCRNAFISSATKELKLLLLLVCRQLVAPLVAHVVSTSFYKFIQRFFQHFECFFQAQHQRRHFLPVQVKGIGVAKHMAESQVFIQRVVQFFRQQRRAVHGR